MKVLVLTRSQNKLFSTKILLVFRTCRVATHGWVNYKTGFTSRFWTFKVLNQKLFVLALKLCLLVREISTPMSMRQCSTEKARKRSCLTKHDLIGKTHTFTQSFLACATTQYNSIIHEVVNPTIQLPFKIQAHEIVPLHFSTTHSAHR